MANRNDYNYYKNEYGKYKDNYYSPGSEAYKKRKIGSAKQKFGRIFRAFCVFVIIAAVVVGLVFGIIKLSSFIRLKSAEKETEAPSTTITESNTVKEESTTKKAENEVKFKPGTKCVVKTQDGTGINLRKEPKQDLPGFRLLMDGETVVIDKLSSDGKWCKTANLDENGWVNLKYLQVVGQEESTTGAPETTTEAETTTKPEEATTEAPTQVDTDISNYAEAVEAFKSKPAGTVMNCKIKSSDVIFARANPDTTSTQILYLMSGDSVQVIGVSGSYSKVRNAYGEGWVPNENLTFVSWG
ncbi:MAG: hypothetical protein E7536_02195 [Ruminococcaceae bacterium]|nr:hypothetical protein [Oscillospiraceae bacterium]